MNRSPTSAPPGAAPQIPVWGQERVAACADIVRRIRPRAHLRDQVAVVTGACGSLGPDIVHAARLAGYGAVVAVDVAATYVTDVATYRALDLRAADDVAAFFASLATWAAARGLRVGAIYNLATVQTSPTGVGDRAALVRGKNALVDALCRLPGDVNLFHMSTAEVYGAPVGAPYGEAHATEPVNDYGRMKLDEERQLLAANGRATRGGVLRVTALRTWTIVMVNRDERGIPVAPRNYNDPLVMVAASLARAGLRIPLPVPTALGQFHPSAEVAEVALCLGRAPADAPCWGRAYNCTGRASSHRDIAEVCYRVFAGRGRRRWWAPLARVLTANGSLPPSLLRSVALAAERFGSALGARDMAGRIPFLYRSTHMNPSDLQRDFGDQLTDPGGAIACEAVEDLAVALRNGGGSSLAERRYQLY